MSDEAAPAEAPAPAPRRKLSYSDRRELAELPSLIEALEAEERALHATLADPELYRSDGAAVARVQQRLADVGRELAETLARWEALAELAG